MPTPHQFHLGEKIFYGWCALDTLIFPALLQITGTVVSQCPATGKQIRLTETPETIVSLEPGTAVISARSPGEQQIPATCEVAIVCKDTSFFLELLTERQQTLRPGIISSLLEARLNGRPLTEEELLGFCGQLFMGANVEITPFLGNVVQSLIEHPEVADELRAEPGLIPSAIEETLRFYPSLPKKPRRGEQQCLTPASAWYCRARQNRASKAQKDVRSEQSLADHKNTSVSRKRKKKGTQEL